MSDEPTGTQTISAEVLGTFVLVFFGCGTAVISGGDYVATGFAFGLTVLVMAYAVGRISGGHFNPAVTIGAAIGGRLSWLQVPMYVGAQLAGAVAAGLSLFILFHGFEGFEAEGHMGQNSFGDAGSGYAWWAAFLLEALMTMIFIMVILALTDGRQQHTALAPLGIGLALTMIHYASIGATGTSVNPARSIGVGLFAGTDAIIQLWLFILAPTLGGLLGGLLYPLLFGHGTAPVEGSGLRAGRATQAVVPVVPDEYQEQWNQEQRWPTGEELQQPAAPPAEPWQQPPPQQPPAQSPAQQPLAQQPPPQAPPSGPPQQAWPGDDGPESTQIRPPQQ